MLCPEAMAASAGGFEASPCSLLKAPLKLNTEQQGQEGPRHSCSVSVFLPKAGSARTCVISDGIPRVLFVFPFSSYFLLLLSFL